MCIDDLELQHADKLYVGGEWVDPSTERKLSVVHPATGELAIMVAEAREDDIDRAIAAARKAFDEGPWPRLLAEERAAYLLRFADAIAKRHKAIALAQTIQIGAPLGPGLHVAAGLAEEARRTAGYVESFAFSEVRPAKRGAATIVREPVGVVAAIVPWNLPAHLGLIKMCPALLAGCTLVVKPSPEAPLDMLLIAEAASEAGFPKGVLSIMPADRDIGDRLIRDPRIDKVSFTGSTAAGRHIGAVCMDRVARVSLELGGKSAAIVLDDMPIDKATPSLVAMSTILNGQACMGLTRILVSKQRQARLTEAMAAAYADLKVGDPFDLSTRIGPLASERQRERVERYIQTGPQEGARIATGGGRPAEFDRGYYVQPTVFADVSNDMTIAREEIFGPVVCVIGYDDVDDAVRIANDTIYGLNGAVFTEDAKQVMALARRLRTGTVAQNGMGPQAGFPFGGFRQSGIGREGSIEALDLFTEVKTIYSLS
jgi:acyl-CoA reductase-like NAD-dependent aldehyde dehydrogenase